MNAPTSPIVPASITLPASTSTPGFRSPAEIAAGVEPRTQPPMSTVGVPTRNQAEVVVPAPAAPPIEAPRTVDTKSQLKRKAAQRKGKPAVERKPRTAPLTMVQRLQILKLIEQARPTETDAELADKASALMPRAVSPQLISAYRVQLGQQSVKEPTKAEMRARMAELERQLEESKQAKLFPHIGAGLARGGSASGMSVGVIGRGNDGNLTFERINPGAVLKDQGNPLAITGEGAMARDEVRKPGLVGLVPPTDTNPMGIPGMGDHGAVMLVADAVAGKEDGAA